MSFTEWEVRGVTHRLRSSFDAWNAPGDPVPLHGLRSDGWQRSYFGVHLKGHREEYGDWNIVNRDRICTLLVPLWAIAAPLAILPALWLLRARPALRRRRLKAGLCLQCGYDVRASPERCPECGSARDRGARTTDASRLVIFGSAVR